MSLTPNSATLAFCACDGAMKVLDIGIWAHSWLGPYAQTADFNCDGTVDVIDVALLAAGYPDAGCGG